MKNELGCYLAGLIEGDGSIYVPTGEKIKNNPKIEIIFHKNDFPLALEISKKIDKCALNEKKGKNVYVLSFNKKETIIKLIKIINGKFRTPKILKLHLLINFMNNKYGLNIPLLPIDESDISSNSWFSGFTEADGCFMIRATQSSYKISCIFSLEQRTVDVNNKSLEQIMKKIGDFYDVKLKITNRKNKNNTFLLRVTSLKGLLKKKNYFSKYPLFGVKYLNYKDFMEVFTLIKTKKTNNYSKEEFFENCKKIKNLMNNKRTYYNFFHLKDFYNY